MSDRPDGCGVQAAVFLALLAGWLLTRAAWVAAASVLRSFEVRPDADAPTLVGFALPLCWAGGMAGEWLALRWRENRGAGWPAAGTAVAGTAVAGALAGSTAAGVPAVAAGVLLSL